MAVGGLQVQKAIEVDEKMVFRVSTAMEIGVNMSVASPAMEKEITAPSSKLQRSVIFLETCTTTNTAPSERHKQNQIMI